MQINQSLSPFEAQVLQLLTEIKVKVEDVAGTSTKPGRMDVAENRIVRLMVGLIAVSILAFSAASPHLTWIISWILK